MKTVCKAACPVGGCDEDRRDILQQKWSSDDHLLIFDELYKFPRWKSGIKGIYDVAGDKHFIHGFRLAGRNDEI